MHVVAWCWHTNCHINISIIFICMNIYNKESIFGGDYSQILLFIQYAWYYFIYRLIAVQKTMVYRARYSAFPTTAVFIPFYLFNICIHWTRKFGGLFLIPNLVLFLIINLVLFNIHCCAILIGFSWVSYEKKPTVWFYKHSRAVIM